MTKRIARRDIDAAYNAAYAKTYDHAIAAVAIVAAHVAYAAAIATHAAIIDATDDVDVIAAANDELAKCH